MNVLESCGWINNPMGPTFSLDISPAPKAVTTIVTNPSDDDDERLQGAANALCTFRLGQTIFIRQKSTGIPSKDIVILIGEKPDMILREWFRTATAAFTKEQILNLIAILGKYSGQLVSVQIPFDDPNAADWAMQFSTTILKRADWKFFNLPNLQVKYAVDFEKLAVGIHDFDDLKEKCGG